MTYEIKIKQYPSFEQMSEALYEYALLEAGTEDLSKTILAVFYGNEREMIRLKEEKRPIPVYAIILTRNLWSMFCEKEATNE